MDFLFLRVALQFDDLHAVTQRLSNGIKHVGGRDEEDFRQVECHVQIVIAESRVLLWIEGLEERRRWITAKIAADFVDFVEHENRIFGLSAADALDDLSRQGADVSAPVPANFSLVMHTAEGQTNEFASQSACDGFPERSLPHSRRPDEAKNGTFHSRLEPAN